MIDHRTADEVRASIRRDAKIYEDVSPDLVLTKGQKGAIVGALSRGCRNDDTVRRIVLGWLFKGTQHNGGELSSKALGAGDWFALWIWMDFYQGEDNKWHTSARFNREIHRVAQMAMQDYINFWSKYLPIDEVITAAAIKLGGKVTRVEFDDPYL